jgi:hypothetical protein
MSGDKTEGEVGRCLAKAAQEVGRAQIGVGECARRGWVPACAGTRGEVKK